MSEKRTLTPGSAADKSGATFARAKGVTLLAVRQQPLVSFDDQVNAHVSVIALVIISIDSSQSLHIFSK